MAMGERIAALVLPRLSASAAGRLAPVRGYTVARREPVGPAAGRVVAVWHGQGKCRWSGVEPSHDHRVGLVPGDRLHITLLLAVVKSFSPGPEHRRTATPPWSRYSLIHRTGQLPVGPQIKAAQQPVLGPDRGPTRPALSG